MDVLGRGGDITPRLHLRRCAAGDVGAHPVHGVVVDVVGVGVGARSQVDHGLRAELGEQLVDGGAVPHVDVAMGLGPDDRTAYVQVEHVVPLLHELVDEIAADEAGATRHGDATHPVVPSFAARTRVRLCVYAVEV